MVAKLMDDKKPKTSLIKVNSTVAHRGHATYIFISRDKFKLSSSFVLIGPILNKIQPLKILKNY